MTDLIFHIGLPKCASSTLQQSVFRHEEGYFGTAPDIAPEMNLAKQIQRVAPFDGRQTINKKGLQQWANRLNKLGQQTRPGSDRLILSNEMLSSASRLNDRPMLKVLSLLRQRYWTEGKVKVVLVLRNQAARLASGYAQVTNCRFRPGQSDFERIVDQHLKSRRRLRLFDYSRWVHGLESIIGPENVCVLLVEESRTVEFWQRLSEFCRLQHLDPQSMVTDKTNSKNKRSQSVWEWSIRDFDPAFLAKVTAEKWLNAIWPANRLQPLRSRFRRQAISWLEERYRRKAEQISKERKRETQFHLSPHVMEIVHERCGTFNDQLARQLDKDLQPLGY